MKEPARNAPPRLPRALFIAAFAVAGARVVTLKAPPIPRPTPYRLERRDRSIAHIARGLGRAIMAAGRAHAAFEAQGGAVVRSEAPKRRLDPIEAALIGSAGVAAAIGRPEPEPCEDAPWIEVDRDGFAPCVRIYWRGDFIQGDRMAKLLVKDAVTGRERIVDGQGETTGSSRTLDMERFALATEAARTDLRAAGVRLSTFCEVKRVNTPLFKGAIATIGLARASVVDDLAARRVR